MTKILITSVSAGAGHTRAAQAVEQYLKKDPHEVKHVDLMDFSKGWFRKLYTEQYLELVNKHPNVWKVLYSITDKPSGKFAEGIRRQIEDYAHADFFQYVEEYKPELVISTHFMPPEVLQSVREKTGLTFKIVTVVTDFDVHYLWVNTWTDLYLVAGKMAKTKLESYGISSDKIKITGIPVMPQFFQKDADLESLNRKWNIIPDYIKVLLMAGGAGVGDLDVLAKNVLSVHPKVQLIALAGRNAELLAKLKVVSELYEGRLTALGFTTEVHELMRVSDIVVTKPGGLSTSECLALRKPMILVNAIPGQEEHNAEYLQEQEYGVWTQETEGLVQDIQLMEMNLNKYKDNLEKAPKLDTEALFRAIVSKL